MNFLLSNHAYAFRKIRTNNDTKIFALSLAIVDFKNLPFFVTA